MFCNLLEKYVELPGKGKQEVGIKEFMPLIHGPSLVPVTVQECTLEVRLTGITFDVRRALVIRNSRADDVF